MHLLGRVLVSTIKVLSAQGAPIVAIDDSIHVDHWYYLKDEMLSQRPCLYAIANQELYDALHHPGGVAFAGVHASTQKDTFLG